MIGYFKISLFILFIVLSNILFAQELDKKYSFSINLGYSQFNIDDIISSANSAGLFYDELNGGISISGKAIYNFNNSFSSFTGFGYFIGTTDLKSSIPWYDENANELGDIEFTGEYKIQIIPLSLGLLYKLNFMDISINLGGGFEYYFAKITHKVDFEDFTCIVGGKIKTLDYENFKTGNNLGLMFIIKPERRITETISVNSEIGYRFSDLISSQSLSDNLNLEIGGLFFNLGVCFYF